MRINEIFYSIQGEGVLMGAPSVFVRTSGCNLRCEWCDTEYAWYEGEEISVDEIMRRVRSFSPSYVCVTGGEPLIQRDIYRLLSAMIESGFHTTLETNGSVTLEEVPCSERLMISMDMKCPSSGMSEKMIIENLELLSPFDQLKFIVSGQEDLDFAREIIEGYDIQCPIILTPVGGLDLRPLAEWVISNRLPVRVLPQLHKIIWGERRGV